MDVKTTFLNEDLEDEIYMEQPEGFVVKGQENNVCKLIKSFYGLKQAPKQWHEKFDQIILSFGFQINNHDKCVYSKIIDNDCVILCFYVDDILIFGTSLEIISSVKSFLSSKFEMKDLGEADVILGMKLIKSHEGIALFLSHSIEKNVKKFSYSNLKSVSTPFDPSFHLKKNLGDPINQLKYSQIIGSLLYVANRIRPDIAYAVGRLSRYNQNPDQSHWVALERVFQYLKGTLNMSLMFTEYPEVVEGYSDANWVIDSHDLKSTIGYLFLLGSAAIVWGSTRQTIISRSTMEAELIAVDTTCNEAVDKKSNIRATFGI